jgi:hypothetical protein
MALLPVVNTGLKIVGFHRGEVVRILPLTFELDEAQSMPPLTVTLLEFTPME